MKHAQYWNGKGFGGFVVGSWFIFGLLAVDNRMFPEKLMVNKPLPRIPDGVEGSDVDKNSLS